MHAFAHRWIELHRSSYGSFCKQCALSRKKFDSVPLFQRQRVQKVFGNAIYFLCTSSETPTDEIDETIKEAQGSELSRVDSDLLTYALMGNVLGVQQALAGGAKAGVKDKEGRTALHLASAIGVPSICEILLKAAGELAELDIAE
ncbi:Ankyrin repeat domain-containing protein 2 [Galdieria sulphuraria]|nr:Ankyrin repeat domain-containing protein 2 [Galdieria sulphuraria]